MAEAAFVLSCAAICVSGYQLYWLRRLCVANRKLRRLREEDPAAWNRAATTAWRGMSPSESERWPGNTPGAGLRPGGTWTERLPPVGRWFRPPSAAHPRR